MSDKPKVCRTSKARPSLRSARALAMENIMSAAIKPTPVETTLPNSSRVYINGQQPGVRVPFREIALNPSRNFAGALEENESVRVYDTSGPWGDPKVSGDVRDGLN